MADQYEDPFNISPIQIRPKEVDIGGGQQLQPAVSIPTPQPIDTNALMAQLLVNQHQQQPASGVPSAQQTVQNMQAGQTPANAMAPTRIPVQTTTAPINTLDMNVQPDPMADLAKNIGTALNKPVTLPTVPTKPADAAANYQLEQRKATDQYYSGLNAEDQANNAKTAALGVAAEFPGQNPAMFPDGLSKTLEGGETFRAFPTGGYSSARTAAGQDAIVAARKANYEKNIAGTSTGQEAARRTTLLNQVNPLDYGTRAAPPTSALEALAARGQGPAVRPATRPVARTAAAARPTDAMSNPAILRSIIASNRYDAGVRQRAQQRLRQLTQ